MQSAAKATFRPPIAFSNGPIKGRRESAGSGPALGRPKCDITTTRAPLPISASMVGASRSMRVASVTTPALMGTFRSARNSTRLPRTSMSLRVLKLAMGPVSPDFLIRAVAVDGDAMHDSLLAMVIVDGVVLDAAIVPERDRVRTPAEPAGELRARRMAIEIIEEGRALRLGHVRKTNGECPVDKQRLAAGLGMASYDRVLDLSLGGVAAPNFHRALALGEIVRPRTVGATRAMHRGQISEHPLHALGQRVVGQVHVGEQRIAAEGGNFASIEDRAQRRLFEIGHVRVPGAAKVAAGFVLLFPDLEDFRVIRHCGNKVMDVEIAKTAAECQMLFRSEVLVAEKYHLMVEEGPADFRDDRVVERSCEIDPRDLGAECSCDPAHIECPVRHFSSSCSFRRRQPIRRQCVQFTPDFPEWRDPHPFGSRK